MTAMKNWLTCPSCDYGWDITEGRNCPMCKTEGEADGEWDNGSK
jgi:hypothetical protein